MKIKFGLVLVIIGYLSLTACGGSGSKSTPAQPENQQPSDKAEAPKGPAEPTEDKQIQRSTTLREVMDRKVLLVYNEKIQGIDISSRLTFQNGEILKTEKDAQLGLRCTLFVRNGKVLTPGDSVQIKFKGGNGFGTGENGNLDYIGVTNFEVSGSNKINEFVCSYRGNDPLLDVKLSDLDQAFGEWFKVIVFTK